MLVDEPSVEDTIAILRGLKERYENHHGVRIQDSALIAAASLSDRYIADRFLPDKAIDLIDEAASRLRIEIDSLPTEIDEVDRRVMQLEIELTSLAKETDDASAQRREAIERELAEQRERSAAMKAQWQSEKDAIQGVSDLKKQLEEARSEVERAERAADLQRAAELRYGEIPELEKSLPPWRAARRATDGEPRPWPANRRGSPTARNRAPQAPILQTVFLKEEVDADDVAEVVARWTGIPVTRLLEGEVEKLVHMEERLHERVIGQDEAVEAVASALRRSRAGPAGPRPPDRLVPVPRPDRRRQDRARARARRVPLRHAGRDDPHRHVRVHGEAHRLAPGRRAPRLRRLRRGRPADRGGAPPALLASCCSTRSRRPTPTSSTRCCRCSTTAA